jgi:hypothetical protein
MSPLHQASPRSGLPRVVTSGRRGITASKWSTTSSSPTRKRFQLAQRPSRTLLGDRFGLTQRCPAIASRVERASAPRSGLEPSLFHHGVVISVPGDDEGTSTDAWSWIAARLPVAFLLAVFGALAFLAAVLLSAAGTCVSATGAWTVSGAAMSAGVFKALPFV